MILSYLEWTEPGTLQVPPLRYRVPVYDALPLAGVSAGELAGCGGRLFVWTGAAWGLVCGTVETI